MAALERDPHNALGEAKALQKLEQEVSDDALAQRIERFLVRYRGWYFSPARIRNWGSQQRGFSQLKQPTDLIERTLQRMLAARKVRTKTSEHGNTLYGAK